VFAEVGQEVHIEGGLLRDAVDRGVSQGYTEGIWQSSVADPLRRVNTGDNTQPSCIDVVEGDKSAYRGPKGAGSENMSSIRMLLRQPDGRRSSTMWSSVSSVPAAIPARPLVVGVGIGGNFEVCALLAKHALCSPISTVHPDPYYQALREECSSGSTVPAWAHRASAGDHRACGDIEAAPLTLPACRLRSIWGAMVTRHASRTLYTRSNTEPCRYGCSGGVLNFLLKH
jgi:fumarate hydratase subunit alpha